jgi:hypothetical protein
LGAFVAKVDWSLRDFVHDGIERTHLWDLANVSLLREFTPYIPDEGRRALAEAVRLCECRFRIWSDWMR